MRASLLSLATLIIIIAISGCTTGNTISPAADSKLTNLTTVTKIIDGDTVVVEGGSSVRLLGIDADERGYPCYDPAKQRLEELVLNKEVSLVSDSADKDQYQRLLRFLILDGENINTVMVKEGFAVARFYPENQKFKADIVEAEKTAIENKVGCKWGGGTQAPESDATIWPNTTGAIDACNAGNYIGQEKVVEGKVVDAYKSSTNTVFLNFGKAYPNSCFTAVIFQSAAVNFPDNPQVYYKSRIVRVTGQIKEYEGKPEIILDGRKQIAVAGG